MPLQGAALRPTSLAMVMLLMCSLREKSKGFGSRSLSKRSDTITKLLNFNMQPLAEVTRRRFSLRFGSARRGQREDHVDDGTAVQAKVADQDVRATGKERNGAPTVPSASTTDAGEKSERRASKSPSNSPSNSPLRLTVGRKQLSRQGTSLFSVVRRTTIARQFKKQLVELTLDKSVIRQLGLAPPPAPMLIVPPAPEAVLQLLMARTSEQQAVVRIQNVFRRRHRERARAAEELKAVVRIQGRFRRTHRTGTSTTCSAKQAPLEGDEISLLVAASEPDPKQYPVREAARWLHETESSCAANLYFDL